MEIRDRLALDDLTRAYDVVAGREAGEDDVDPERTKRVGNARASLADVSGYRHANVSTHPIISSEQRQLCATFAPTLRRDCLWQFPAEGRELP
jgi:hypothetical protein